MDTFTRVLVERNGPSSQTDEDCSVISARSSRAVSLISLFEARWRKGGEFRQIVPVGDNRMNVLGVIMSPPLHVAYWIAHYTGVNELNILLTGDNLADEQRQVGLILTPVLVRSLLVKTPEEYEPAWKALRGTDRPLLLTLTPHHMSSRDSEFETVALCGAVAFLKTQELCS